MIDICSIYKWVYEKNRDMVKQRIFDEHEAELDTRFHATQDAIVSGLSQSGLDENSCAIALSIVRKALHVHSPNANRMTEHIMGALDKIVLKTKETRKQ